MAYRKGYIMFLTKKAFWKILIMALCYIFLGSVFVALSFVYSVVYSTSDTVFFVMGVLMYILCPLIALLGYYSEAKAKHVNLANKLVRNELKPAEFIKHYEQLRRSPDLMVKKPSFELLYMAVMAYDALDDREKSLLTADEMIALGEKKRMQAQLVKASLMFSYDMKDEAEALFDSIRNQKKGLMAHALCDNILKSDRAMAMGDYKTVESYCLKALEQSFPKLDNLSKIIMNFKLGEIYRRMNETQSAVERYRYCIANGGETAIVRASARAMREISGTHGAE